MENSQFENSFRNAFDGAEVSPSTSVWTNIELSLEKTSGGKLKRNLLMFQLLAAASVVFACGIGAMYYLENQSLGKKERVNELATNQEELVKKDALTSESKEGLNKEEVQPEATKQNLSGNQEIVRSTEDKTVNQTKQNTNTHITNTSVTSGKGTNDAKASQISKQSESGSVIYTVERRGFESFGKITLPALVLPESEKQAEPDAVAVMMARLKDEEKKYQNEEKKKSSENMWASLGFGAGSYKPNRQALSNNSSETGASYSAGLNVAGKISKRIILQGGVSYLSQNADFTSTASSSGTAMLNEFNTGTIAHQDGGGVTTRNPYIVNSSLQFVSIPMQAGYILVDQTFGIQLNGGISTDLFISNTLTSENGNSQKITQSSEESPYRTVNFSGLVGTEFSYRIADHYRISLNPGLRYSLNSIYKDDIAATITPLTFDVSLRFRYIFK